MKTSGTFKFLPHSCSKTVITDLTTNFEASHVNSNASVGAGHARDNKGSRAWPALTKPAYHRDCRSKENRRLSATTKNGLAALRNAGFALFVSVASSSHAANAAVPDNMTAAPATSAPTSAPIGRLFFTPERRVTLERQRLTNMHEAQTLQGATMSLDGVVQRSSGKSTVWINGRAQNESDAARTGVTATVIPKNPGSAYLAPGEETASRMKVGEAMNRATGERDNRLGGGVVVTPATRK